ncbi:hypothetical protein OSB04_016726 [Centaurea solstitialis]|uniref:Uncharacterized protein n=1 Tax=Centaurea solstitialis TaxID=347529 RepID=A0AA38WLC7_9ASTR|nr:hypothetical protein OSB04_016726 [Centaurea solstitialis]
MELFLSGADPQIPNFLERGPYVPTQTVHVVHAADGQPGIPARELEKPVTGLNYEDRCLVSIDTKARSLISMSLPNDVFHFVCHLRTAKEIWNTLCVQYEGTAVLMESRKIFLVRQYKSSIHQKGETLSQTHQRFNFLFIDLKTIGTSYSNSEVITKYKKNQFAPTSTTSSSKTLKYLKLKEKYKKMKSQRKDKGLIVEDCDWDDVSSDESSDKEDTQVALY